MLLLCNRPPSFAARFLTKAVEEHLVRTMGVSQEDSSPFQRYRITRGTYASGSVLLPNRVHIRPKIIKLAATTKTNGLRPFASESTANARQATQDKAVD